MPEQRLDMVTVIKLDSAGRETWRYPARIIKRTGEEVLVEAFFNKPDKPFHDIVMKEGDRFLEQYFFQRWYNIYEIHDRVDGCLKAWYCNISRPAEMRADCISYVDLALDLMVYPDGTQLVLDQDEFDALEIDASTREKAIAALEELKNQFSSAAENNFQ